jgi:hypothetical protein
MNYDALEIPRRNGLRVRSGLLSFETMDWLSLSWAQEVPARGESQPPVVSPRIVIKPERHPSGPGLDAPVDFGVMGEGNSFLCVELRAQS